MKMQGWTASQRRALIVISLALCGWIAMNYYRNRRYVPDPQPAMPELASQLEDKLDLNTADEATLAVLPMIGEKRARDIVAHREAQQKDHPGKPVFTRAEDLTQIKGIGPMTVMQVKPYLMFPTTAPGK